MRGDVEGILSEHMLRTTILTQQQANGVADPLAQKNCAKNTTNVEQKVCAQREGGMENMCQESTPVWSESIREMSTTNTSNVC